MATERMNRWLLAGLVACLLGLGAVCVGLFSWLNTSGAVFFYPETRTSKRLGEAVEALWVCRGNLDEIESLSDADRIARSYGWAPEVENILFDDRGEAITVDFIEKTSDRVVGFVDGWNGQPSPLSYTFQFFLDEDGVWQGRYYPAAFDRDPYPDLVDGSWYSLPHP